MSEQHGGEIHESGNPTVTVGMWRRYALLSSIILFLIACFTPALILHVKARLGVAAGRWHGYRSVYGGNLLVSGLALGWFRLNFTAFANLPLWLSWILFARRRFETSRLFAFVALAISIETLQLLVQPYLWDEGGTTQGYLTAPHIGFICWIGSMLIIAFASYRLTPKDVQAST